MLQEGLRHFEDIPLVVFAMLLFLGVFTGVLIQLARNPRHLHEASHLPFNEENIHDE